MSAEMEMALLDKRIEQFCASSAELLTGLHARKKSADKGMLNQKRSMRETISIPDMDNDFLHEDPLEGLL
ncbi:MAG: hypothetical protein HY757_01315 [Nitrospirae bacterium]|nr:hypothetical protein [Nitrospirota bacterium]